MVKKILILLVAIMIFSNVVYAKEFNDTKGHWAKEYINSISSANIINGYDDGSFKPNEGVSRAEFAKIITKGFNLTSKTDNSFDDVNLGHWFYEYVEAAKDYLTGYQFLDNPPYYNPNAKATREDVAVALVRAMTDQNLIDYNKKANLETEFTDHLYFSYQLRDEISLAVGNSILNGYKNKFRPQDNITRAEISVLFSKILKKSYIKMNEEPHLVIEELPEKTNKDKITLKGERTKDTVLYLNGYEILNYEYDTSGKYDKFYVDVHIKNFGEHKFDFSITLKNGKEKVVTRKIEKVSPAPKIKLDEYPKVTELDSVQITGKIEDLSDYEDITLLAGGTKLNLTNKKEFSFKYELKEGINELTLMARNNFEKSNLIIQIVKPYIKEIEVIKEVEIIKEVEVIKEIKVGSDENENTTDEMFDFDEETNTIYEYIGNAKNITIPKEINGIKVKHILPHSFQDKGLEKVTIEAPLTVIPLLAFAFNFDLEEINLPNTVATIRTQAFQGCTSLKEITLPATLKQFESHTFRDCYKLRTVTFLGNAPKVTPYPFSFIDPFPNIIYHGSGFDSSWFKSISNDI